MSPSLSDADYGDVDVPRSISSIDTTLSFLSYTIMDLNIQYLPPSINEWDLTRILARDILHTDDFHPRSHPDERRINFQVKLNPSKAGGVRNDGTGILTLPTPKIGFNFLDWVKEKPVKIQGKRIKFYFRDNGKKSREWHSTVMTLQRTPYIDPDVEEAHEKKVYNLQGSLRVDRVQFGIFFRPISIIGGKPKSREFSIEWEKEYINESTAWLRFEYDHKLIRIMLGNSMTEPTGYSIAITFGSILKIGLGNDPAAYVCFDTLTPPMFEMEDFHRTVVGNDHEDSRKFKHRIGGLNPGHHRVAPYCQKLRITLCDNDPRQDILQVFRSFCKTAELADSLIAQCRGPFNIEAATHSFFTDKRLFQLRQKFTNFDWSVAFQLESLLYNCHLHTGEMDALLPQIHKLYEEHPHDHSYVAALLRAYNLELPDRRSTENYDACFQRVKTKFEPNEFSLPRGNFHCCHVTFAPTRILLEGPYPTQSNRIIRRYVGYEEYFIRVDFRDEDRLQYRWDRAVDGRSFLQKRVGDTLKNGFEIGGRSFEFLAYSNSALREHAVWFMSPFQHDVEGWVTPDRIRDSIGDFRNIDIEDYNEEDKIFFEKDQKLLRQPSKYAARIAQAFTATDPSVKIRRDEWQMMDDLGQEPYLFTDGVGVISESLANEIWAALCADRGHKNVRSVPPSAYQIRFLGFKGMVVVDKQLDKSGGKIRMRLRPSMRKFGNRSEEEADIEIARSFERPNTSYLNRPLVTILEGRGVRKEAFLDLLDDAVADVYSVDDSLKKSYDFMRNHSLGTTYNLFWMLQRLEKLDCYIGKEEERPSKRHVNIDYPFFKQLREVARMHVLREIKHDARIPIPDSHLLVGVADEGPVYEKDGHKDVYVLPEGHIYACIQRPGEEEPTYIEGNCTISRSPVAHPGDVQRVHAIGKPPPGRLCAFEGLKNVVVLPSAVTRKVVDLETETAIVTGKRSLASCLGGGDLDGDLYDVITHAPLLPGQNEKPASYEAGETLTLDQESTIEDICDFVVEYISSDVLGLLSDRLLVIADQSKDGIYDRDCLKLARLCSLAVDFAKQGIPVDLDKDRLPRTLIRCKPDWHAAEVVDPRGTDYYESTRALGEMFRRVKLATPEDIAASLEENLKKMTLQNQFPSLTDPISGVLKNKIREHLFPYVEPDGSRDAELQTMFSKYRDELRYICATHTVTNKPGATLSEAEVVMGTILDKCSQKRWRKDRMFRMKNHSSMLVKEVTKGLTTCRIKELDERDQALYSLERAWWAWDFSLKKMASSDAGERFGGHSFGLIALDCILHALEDLENLDLQEQSEVKML
ncbi:hypothetical protein V5O48_000928 [Marasmius crinis-equi]|uniref:RNA-dependent RNA polymerase n=1 Tax=Marasmius crinis-equi TaxID=585013 RepID=A0ABR3G0A1_9AGAR